MKKLTAKQAKFVDEYLIDLNATQAAIRAGYSVHTAGVIATEILSYPNIQAAISSRIAARSQRTEITQDYVINVIAETVERCRQAQPVLDKFGKPVLIESRGGVVAAAYVFDPTNVIKGAELLGKHVGLFSTRVNVDINATITHKYDLSGLSDEELRLYRSIRQKVKSIEEGHTIEHVA